MNLHLSLFTAWLGVFILAWRLLPRGQFKRALSGKEPEKWPRVSIVVPARDEEHNMPRLLQSLTTLDYPDYEVVVVDDHSKDKTREIAESFNVKVLASEDLPAGWNGKNWACHQAVPHLSGDIFLFTDADTDHYPDGLKRAIRSFQWMGADMMSSFPYHKVERWWEKLMGPFHTILMAATAPYSPKPKRLFAIGQYLMFSRRSYKKQGGHAAVKSEYPDDLALANACLRAKGAFRIFAGTPLFEVRMYADFKEFVSGWRRNFLAGIQQSNWWATIEVVLIFFGVTGAGRFFLDVGHLVPALIGVAIIAIRQRRWGRFSLWGVLLLPVSLLLFCFVTVLSVYDYATGNVLRWKGRSYTGWVTKVQ